MTSRLTETEAAYLAGFFDGEGHVRWTQQERLRVQISQKDKEVLEWIKSVYGGGIYAMHGAYSWEVNGPGARSFLDDVGPYIRIKRKQIESTYAQIPEGRLEGTRTLDDIEVLRVARIEACREALELRAAGELNDNRICLLIMDKYNIKSKSVVYRWLHGHRPFGWRDPIDM